MGRRNCRLPQRRNSKHDQAHGSRKTLQQRKFHQPSPPRRQDSTSPQGGTRACVMKLLALLLLIGVAVLADIFVAGRTNSAASSGTMNVVAQTAESESEVRSGLSEPDRSPHIRMKAAPQHM